MKTPTTRSPRKAKGHGAERREEILEAALTLFSERGVHAVSTRQIAELAGISQPALYAYFATKDDMADELCVRAFAVLVERMKAARVVGEPTVANFERSLRVYVDFGIESPNAYRVAFMIEKGPHGHGFDKRDSLPMLAGLDAFAMFRDIVGEYQAAGLTVLDDPQLATQTLWAGLHGLVSLLIARSEFPWVDREALIDAHIAMLRRGALK